MKKLKNYGLVIITLLVFVFTYSAFAQEVKLNEPDSLSNLILSEGVIIYGSLSEVERGTPIDIVYDPQIKNYVTETSFAEYGVKYNTELEVDEKFFWGVRFSETKLINYITFAGPYENQPQPETNWEIKARLDEEWTILESGRGGWIDSGIYEFKIEQPIEVDEITLNIFPDEGKKLWSISLRGRGGTTKSYRDKDEATSPKATLVQLLPYEEDAVVTPSIDEIIYEGKYKVYENGNLVFEDDDELKANKFASNVKNEKPDSEVKLHQPILEYLRGEGGHVVAQIQAIREPSRNYFLINEPIKNIEYGNGCESDSKFMMTSNKPFDFKDIPVILNNADWYVQRGLFNNGVKLTSMEALTRGLVVLKCTDSQLILSKNSD